MVEGARLERGCAVTRTEGSNPSLSAIKKPSTLDGFFVLQIQAGFEPVRVLADCFAAIAVGYVYSLCDGARFICERFN